MAFGIYVHIPYCLQICSYCDFTKYELGKSLAPELYVELLKKEIRTRSVDVPKNTVDTIYFGGGTPSLLEPGLILTILEELAKAGFVRSPDAEITIEIDPATCDQSKLDSYLEMGINRFSVGAQSFNDRLLKLTGRKHSSSDTVEILSMLKRNKVNYSFDLLFALPTQSLSELKADVATALAFDPSHLSAYYLTVPEGHRLSVGRAPEEDQVEMFHLIESVLNEAGIARYEISNFARPGFESRHNLLYWTDQPYWGIGLSSHSYLPNSGPWGTRFWNARAMKKYEQQVASSPRFSELPEDQVEALKKNQALTDYCHTSLRLLNGLDENALRLKFGSATADVVCKRLFELEKAKLIRSTNHGWALDEKGLLIANSVFETLTFLSDEI